MKKLRLMAVALAALVAGCGWLSQDKINNARDAVKTFDDLAQRGCAIFYGDTYGLSLEDAANIYCNDERVQKFRDVFLTGAQSADTALGSKPPSEMK